MTHKKILFIVPNLTPGGIQTQVVLLARFLKGKGFKVKIVGLNGSDVAFKNEVEGEGIEMHHRPEIGQAILSYDSIGPSEKLSFWLRMIRWLRSEKADVILPYTAAIDDVVNVIWRLTRAKRSFSFERGGHLEPKRQKKNWIRRLKKLSRPTYVANSRHGATSLAIMRGVSIGKVHVIRNAYIAPDAESAQNVPVEMDFTGKVVFIMLANFFDQKDHQFLLKAWYTAKLSRSVLLLLGLGGTEKCKKNYEEAKKFVRGNDLEDQVFFGGAVGSPWRLLSLASVGLLTSRTEGCPNAVLEYMGAGLPVLARDIPGVREVLPEENKKLLTGFEDQEGLARQMRLMEMDKELRERIGAVNSEHVISEFKAENMYEAYHKLILRN